jgi:hypothetical protein
MTDLEIVTHELLAYGSIVVALGTYRARVAGTGAEITLPYTHVWVFNGEAARELQQYAVWRARPRTDAGTAS